MCWWQITSSFHSYHNNVSSYRNPSFPIPGGKRSGRGGFIAPPAGKGWNPSCIPGLVETTLGCSFGSARCPRRVVALAEAFLHQWAPFITKMQLGSSSDRRKTPAMFSLKGTKDLQCSWQRPYVTCSVFSRASKEQKECPMKVKLYLTLMNSNAGRRWERMIRFPLTWSSTSLDATRVAEIAK